MIEKVCYTQLPVISFLVIIQVGCSVKGRMDIKDTAYERPDKPNVVTAYKIDPDWPNKPPGFEWGE